MLAWGSQVQYVTSVCAATWHWYSPESAPATPCTTSCQSWAEHITTTTTTTSDNNNNRLFAALFGQFGPGSIRFPRTHACCVLPGNRPVWIILLGSRGAGHNSLKLILDGSQSIPYCLPECWNSVINIKRLRFWFVLCLQKKSFLFRLKCCILETLW